MKTSITREKHTFLSRNIPPLKRNLSPILTPLKQELMTGQQHHLTDRNVQLGPKCFNVICWWCNTRWTKSLAYCYRWKQHPLSGSLIPVVTHYTNFKTFFSFSLYATKCWWIRLKQREIYLQSDRRKKNGNVLVLVTSLNLCDHKYRWCQEQQWCLTDYFIIDTNILIFISIYSWWLPVFHKWHYTISFKLEVLPLNPCPMVISCIWGTNFPRSKCSTLQTCIFPK